MPFTLNNFFNAASAALPQGMNIGMQGLAEMQRRKELADEIARQQELQAFNQRMATQQFQRQRELDSYNQAQDALARQDANYRADTDAVYRDTKLRTDLEQQLIDNNLAKRELGMRENVANAQIANYQEPNNRWAAGVEDQPKQPTPPSQLEVMKTIEDVAIKFANARAVPFSQEWETVYNAKVAELKQQIGNTTNMMDLVGVQTSKTPGLDSMLGKANLEAGGFTEEDVEREARRRLGLQ